MKALVITGPIWHLYRCQIGPVILCAREMPTSVLVPAAQMGWWQGLYCLALIDHLQRSLDVHVHAGLHVPRLVRNDSRTQYTRPAAYAKEFNNLFLHQVDVVSTPAEAAWYHQLQSSVWH
jgi:hypothetical protein